MIDVLVGDRGRRRSRWTPTLAATAASIGAATLALAATAPAIGAARSASRAAFTSTLSRSPSSVEAASDVTPVVPASAADGVPSAAGAVVPSAAGAPVPASTTSLPWSRALSCGALAMASPVMPWSMSASWSASACAVGADREDVGADGCVDRRGHVGVGGDREVDRGGEVEREVEVDVEVEQRDHLLGRKCGAGLGGQLVRRQGCQVLLGHERYLPHAARALWRAGGEPPDRRGGGTSCRPVDVSAGVLPEEDPGKRQLQT